MEALIHIEPCPFCGLSPDLARDLTGAVWRIACGECGAEGPPVYPTGEASGMQIVSAAVKAWNQRAASGEVTP